jgi:hypothetical protein
MRVAGGASMVVHGLRNSCLGIHLLCTSLEQALHLRAVPNIYVTPPGGRQGFIPHFDDHGVFVIQLAGAKKWTLWDQPATAMGYRAHKHNWATIPQAEREGMLQGRREVCIADTTRGPPCSASGSCLPFMYIVNTLRF